MRLLKLGLRAFGPFTDRELDLSAGEEGLHVLYGANEAGKSTSLRAVIGLLFGIPATTRDDHVHAMKQLRIGGTLRNAAGQELSFVRRKGNRGTVLDPDDDKQAIDDAALAPFLAGVDRSLFKRLYGIDHERLVSGGNELLAQTGDLGQALFSAALGTASLREVCDELDTTAADLYKPGGSKPSLNAALRNYKAAAKEVGETGLAANVWTRLNKEQDRLDARIKELEASRDTVTRAQSRLERARRVLGPIAQLDQAKMELEPLEGVVLLPDDFGVKVREAREGLRAANKSIERAETDIEELIGQEATLEVSDTILGAADAIEAVQQNLGVAEEGRKDRPTLEGQVRQLRNQARTILATSWPDLSIDEAERLRPVLERRAWIGELSTASAGLTARGQGAHRSLQEAKEALDALPELDDELVEADPGPLEAAVASARQAGDLERQLALAQGKLKTETRTCDRDLERLPLFSGSLDVIDGLDLPGSATLDRFEARFSAVEGKGRELEAEDSKLSAERDTIERGLRSMLEAGDVPTQDQLADARRSRQEGWSRIRRGWIEPGDGGRDEALPDIYEQRVQRADDVADRLRREAARVEKHAGLAARQRGNDEGRQEHRAAVQELSRRRDELASEWSQLWAGCGIDPLSPREMQGWLRQAEKLREALTARRAAQDEVDRLRDEIDASLQAVSRELVRLGRAGAEQEEGLSARLARADQLVKDLHRARRQQQQRKVWDQQAARAREALAAVEAEQQRWREDWRQAIEGLDLPDEAPPAHVLARLEEVEKLFKILNTRGELLGRIRGIDKRLEEFAAEVRQLADRVGMSGGDADGFQVARQLKGALAEARSAQTSQRALVERRRRLDAQLRSAEADRKDLQGEIDRLRKQAQVDREDELEPAERRSTERARLEERAEKLKKQVLEVGDGLSLSALRTELEEADPDAIPAERARLAERQKEHAAELGQLWEQRGGLSSEIGTHDGSEDAAQAAERAEEELATIRADLRRYLLARAQAAILREEMERYRQENQGPVLRRASELFARLTLNSFAGLRDELDAKGKPILLGVRPDDLEVDVERMSEGTRDQLYLALRLATLERQLATSEPMPFIVDDILIGFDDARTRTCLEVLGELATRTQVLLFTHHDAVVEQSAALSCDAGVFVHRL